MACINRVKIKPFLEIKLKLMYKMSEEIYLFSNYRPMSLINVAIKIMTEILAKRLKYILPTIIHASQTAVYGRKIDQTMHMIRDIERANKENKRAAFIFSGSGKSIRQT